jgi:hypothetical protein
VPTPLVCNYLGSLTIRGAPAESGDEVAVFDRAGILCGRFQVITGGVYGIVQVYGDDILTADVDEGAVSGETLSFSVWDSAPGLLYTGEEVQVLAGQPVGSFLASSVPPVWIDRGGFVLDVRVCESSQCSVFTLELEKGWNLVSTPLALADSRVDAVLRRPGADQVCYTGTVWQWNGETLEPARDFTPGKGYWVQVPEAVQIVLHGFVRTANQRYNSGCRGWNLIGPEGLTPLAIPVDAVFAHPVWTWHAQTCRYLRVTAADEHGGNPGVLLPGHGYWLFRWGRAD